MLRHVRTEQVAVAESIEWRNKRQQEHPNTTGKSRGTAIETAVETAREREICCQQQRATDHDGRLGIPCRQQQIRRSRGVASYRRLHRYATPKIKSQTALVKYQ